MTDAERDAKLRESVADVIACPHTYPSGSDYVKADRVMQIIHAERERVREECAKEAEHWAENYPETLFTPIKTEEVWKPDMSETILSSETGKWITRASADSARNSAKCIAENIRLLTDRS